jgi:hypothetical protein
MRSKGLPLCAALSLLVACEGQIDSPSLRVSRGNGDPSNTGGSSSASQAGTSSSTSGSSATGGRSDDPNEPLGFEPLPPASYLTKVKSMLTGRAPTAEELASVTTDPSALKRLIAEWQQTPDYEARLRDFFTMAFQQGEVTAEQILNVTPYEQAAIDERVIQSMRESFGRTAVQLVKEKRPFTEVLTTRRFMVTPALLVAMTWLDERTAGDGGGGADALSDKLGAGAKYTMQADRQIPLADSANPGHADYLTFYAPQVAAASADCRKPVVVDTQNRLTLYTNTTGETLMRWLLGQQLSQGFCSYQGKSILSQSDFDTWRMVTFRQPKAGEETTWVYEVPKHRNAEEIVMRRPMVGFYTTPAFLYTWQTNTSNQARVTANQTLIVAVGRNFDGTLGATPASPAAIASEHAKPGSDCYNCHVTMDPMRQFFRNTYSYNWTPQTDSKITALPGVYAFDGDSHIGQGIADLGESLGQNKRFASGWVHKLCTWATGAACDPSGSNLEEPSDPELVRLIDRFNSSNYDFNDLVQELFSSPLVTYASATKTTDTLGPTHAIEKRAQLCQKWDQRLGLTDACGLGALPSTTTGDPVKTIATVLPSDQYSRGQTMPTLSNDPGLFFFAGIENICSTLAARVVGDGAAKFKTADAEAAMQSMVTDVMSLLPPRDTAALTILREHRQAVLAKGNRELDALRSTFVLACSSAPAVGQGL